MSQEQVPHDPELTEIEEALGSLVPARSRLDRDRLMFRSGQVAPRPMALGRWGWPSIAAALAVVALGEGTALVSRPAPRVIERLVVVKEAAPQPVPVPFEILSQAPPIDSPADAPFSESSVLASSGYEQLERQVLRFGPDGLPELPPLALQWEGPSPGADLDPSGALLRSEIARLLNPGEPS